MSRKTDDHVGFDEGLGEHTTNPAQPSQRGELLSWRGNEYTVSEVENRIRGQFEQYVKREARRAVDEIQLEDPVQASIYRSTYLRDYSAGKYKWGREYTSEAIQSADGASHLLYLCITRSMGPGVITHDQVLQMMLEIPEQTMIALGWALGNSTESVSTLSKGT